MRRFNQAFQRHHPDALTALVAEDCVIENTGPAPNGSRHVGRRACLAVWQGLAGESGTHFEPEEVLVAGDRAESSDGDISLERARATPCAA